MSTTIILVPITSNAGIKTIALSLIEAINSNSRAHAMLLPTLDNEATENLLSSDRINDLLEEAIKIRETTRGENTNQDIMLFLGLPLKDDNFYAAELNYKLATALDASIIFVLTDSPMCPLKDFARQCQIMMLPYLKSHKENVLGYIVNKTSRIKAQPQPTETTSSNEADFLGLGLNLLGAIPDYAKDKEVKKGEKKLQQTPPINFTVLSKHLETGWADRFAGKKTEERLTPPLFRYRLMALAHKAQKRIVLPEGDEPRTIQAANICSERNLAKCILLGEKNSIHQVAKQLGITLHSDILIIEPKTIQEKYVKELYEIRKHKGLTLDAAREMLQDNVVLGTMMLKLDEVDGLVSGAAHTTANTIRPAFQIIKTVSDAKIISSVFFMCLPEQILLYGDCAINVNPTAGELADIAIQSAASAKLFGITPRIAMLSYSTGTSGFGPDVEKVKTAVEIVKQRRPDLAVEGPIQYDAAIDKEVAALKMPQSRVAGSANIFIFPDLNSGNIGYKAVQRATNIVCIGPLLQGMRKPVNDLSRGCLVEDIVFTIALTAIQAGHIHSSS